MPVHWTYEVIGNDAQLAQGDILKPTDALKKVFADVHPHFCDDKYLAFLIATQSCDLVRRASVPKAQYINLAAIRPLSAVVRKILSHVANPVADGIFRTSEKPEARRLFERLLNQNEQALGLFFLHADTDAGIAQPAVAFLRVMVALRAEHYDMLLSARIGRLAPEFRAKLGWLIGNLYVRPATKDWHDVPGGEKRLKELIAESISEARWIEDDIINAAGQSGINISEITPEEFEALRPPSRLDRALDQVQEEFLKVAPDVDVEIVAKLKNRLRNNGKFRKLFVKQVE